MEFKGRAIDVLKSFSKDEIKDFSKFLDSPYFNSNQRLIEFYSHIKNFHPDFSGKNFSAENIYKKTFGGAEFNNQIFKNLLSELYKAEKEFLISQKIKENRNERNIFLLHKLRDKKLNSVFDNELEKLKTEINSGNKISANDFLYKSELNLLESHMLMLRGNQNKTTGHSILSSELIINYLFSALSISYGTAVFNEFNYNIKYENKIVDGFLGSFNFERFYKELGEINEQNVFVLIEAKFLDLTFNRYSNAGKELPLIKKVFFEYADLFEKETMREMLNAISVLHIAEIIKGNLEYLVPALELIKYSEENNLLMGLYDDYFDYNGFTTHLRVIHLNKDFEYSEKFINKAKDYLHPDIKKDGINLALALQHFYMNDYDTVIHYLSLIENVEIMVKYSSKGMLLRCFYEKNYFEQIFSTADSFRKFLKKNKSISKIHKEHNLAFTNFIEKLARLKEKKLSGLKINKTDIRELKLQIESEERVNSRKYLLEKVEELGIA